MKIKNLSTLFVGLLFSITLMGQDLPSPQSHFGFSIGTDYQIANFTQTEAYFKKLAESSDRVILESIGKTEEGREQTMLVISAPENLQDLEAFKKISQQLANAKIDEQEAKALAYKGKAVVWIDGGLHATETVGIHQLIETAWQLASRDDAETRQILDEVIVLMVHANPDGQELVSNWYMRHEDPERRSLSFLPRLYEKYAGHDNNRDFYIFNLKESQNMARQLYIEWLPQIMYNHHQSGPAGTVVAGAPYRDPYNYVFDPILMTSIDAVGAAMHNRLNVEGKPGYTQRTGSTFSTWYNGGLRTTTYFHNMVGLLTEIIGSPTPYEMPFIPERMLPGGDSPNPVWPQTWHFQQSIDYSVSLNYAVLGYAARYKAEVLYNIYRMGRNSIERGSRDHWSFSPSKIQVIEQLYQKEEKTSTVPRRMDKKYLEGVMQHAENRDARAYVIPADQADFPTAVKFLNALIKAGIEVQLAEHEFSFANKSYPAGSYVVKTDQAFRPHVLDMFEPQDYPNDVLYPGGPPVPPYDAAGWTLAYQMGVRFDRILDELGETFKTLPRGVPIQLSGQMPEQSAAYYLLNASVNDHFLAINALLSAKLPVYRDTHTGDFYVKTSKTANEILTRISEKTGIRVQTAKRIPQGAITLKPARIALWDRYGGSMPSGWLRWLMETFQYQAEVIFPQEIDAGNLHAQYDVIILMDGAVPGSKGRIPNMPMASDIPEAYRDHLGYISGDKSVPALKAFMEAGGTLVTVGNSANLLEYLDVPVKNALVELKDGKEVPLKRDKFYVPGSILQARVSPSQQATWGMPEQVDVYFNQSPVFKLNGEALVEGTVKPLLWYDSAQPLRSGWAWGAAYLEDGVAAFQTSIGQGDLYVFGPLITFRGQPHGTFKLLFNLLYTHESAY